MIFIMALFYPAFFFLLFIPFVALCIAGFSSKANAGIIRGSISKKGKVTRAYYRSDAMKHWNDPNKPIWTKPKVKRKKR